jgi:hypothetical protein
MASTGHTATLSVASLEFTEEILSSPTNNIQARTLAALALACRILVNNTQNPTKEARKFADPIPIVLKGVNVVLASKV